MFNLFLFLASFPRSSGKQKVDKGKARNQESLLGRGGSGKWAGGLTCDGKGEEENPGEQEPSILLHSSDG